MASQELINGREGIILVHSRENSALSGLFQILCGNDLVSYYILPPRIRDFGPPDERLAETL